MEWSLGKTLHANESNQKKLGIIPMTPTNIDGHFEFEEDEDVKPRLLTRMVSKGIAAFQNRLKQSLATPLNFCIARETPYKPF